MNEILFATDFSESSEYALRFATSLARGCHTGLLIVHCCEIESGPVGECYDEPCEPCPEEVRRLSQVVPNDPDVPYRHYLIERTPCSDNVHPAEELVRLAEQQHVQAIVLGTVGHIGLGRVLSWSVSEAVMRHAPCPVITVRQPHKEWIAATMAPMGRANGV